MDRVSLRLAIRREVLSYLIFSSLILGGMGVARAVPPDPRTPGPFPTAVTVIDQGCNYDLDGTSLTWQDPPFGATTPLTITFGDDDFSGTDPKCPPLVDMELRVHYPGSGGVVASGGPFPVGSLSSWAANG